MMKERYKQTTAMTMMIGKCIQCGREKVWILRRRELCEPCYFKVDGAQVLATMNNTEPLIQNPLEDIERSYLPIQPKN